MSFAVAAAHAPKELAPEEMPRCPGCLLEEMTHYPLPSIWQFLKEPALVIDTVASRSMSSSPGEGGERRRTESIFGVGPRGRLEEQGEQGHQQAVLLWELRTCFLPARPEPQSLPEVSDLPQRAGKIVTCPPGPGGGMLGRMGW